MKKRTFRRIACAATAVMVLMLFAFSASASTDITGAVDYVITNPYATVDWDTWGRYKANLHTHSTVSDGGATFTEMIEAHYAAGYDILGMTDHGCVNRGWNVVPTPVPLLSYNMIFKKPVPLTQQRYNEITTGVGRGGRGMTDVVMGIELNAATLTKTHLNGFFADYGQGDWGRDNDYETPIAGVQAAGGVTFINHPGDWLESAKDVNIAKDPKNIRFFADLYKKYPSCLGMEILNSGDSPTRHDRVLWDGILEKVIPAGRNVWGFANSDAHEVSDIGTSFEYFMLPENNLANVRTAMENGTFFACGKYARPELGDAFVGTGDVPAVTRIIVNVAADTITLEASKYDTVEWVAKGEVIATGLSIDLNAHEDQIGCYVRAQLKGPGGICFTQAFALDDGSAPPPDNIPFFEQLWDKIVFAVKSNIIFVIINELIKELS